MELQFEVFTTMLERAEFFSAVDEVLGMLNQYNVTTVGICFGWAWDKGWITEDINVKDIMATIKQHEQNTKADFGDNDVFISISSIETELLFCHEADIHLSFNQSNSLVKSILDTWKANNLIHAIKRNKEKISMGELGI